MKKGILFLLSILTALIFSSCMTLAKQYDLPESYPNQIFDWPENDKDIMDVVMFNQKVDPTVYSKLIVLPTIQDNVDFDSFTEEEEGEKDADHDSDEDALEFLEIIDELHWEHMDSLNGLVLMPVVNNEPYTISESVLLLETEVKVVNPGSRGLRYSIGFGAGATELTIEGRLIDGMSGEILAVFSHSSFGWGGTFGGGADDLFEESLEDISLRGFGSLLYSLLGE